MSTQEGHFRSLSEYLNLTPLASVQPTHETTFADGELKNLEEPIEMKLNSVDNILIATTQVLLDGGGDTA